jgi:transposase
MIGWVILNPAFIILNTGQIGNDHRQPMASSHCEDVVRLKLPHTESVADLFHVMKQLNHRLSQIRRNLQRNADQQTRQALKGTRWLLVKNRAHLTADEEARLQAALAVSPTLR